MTEDFEDILKDVGEWGRFQKILVMCFGVLVSIMAPIPAMALIFITMTPHHSCRVPANASHLLRPKDSCEMLNTSSAFVNGSVLNTVDTAGCIYGWEYSKEDFESTVSTKWDLVCENSYYPSVLMFWQNIGSLIATPIYSALADRFGRKTLCFVLLLLSSVLQLTSAFVESLLLFSILRALIGTVLPTVYIIPFILISEFMPPNKRVLVNGIFNFGWMAGMCLMPLVGYLARDWVRFTIINALLSALILFCWRYVPESASWLLSQKRYEDAAKIMTEIGRKNNCIPNEGYIEKKLKELGENKNNMKEDSINMLLFFKYPRLRMHFIILTICWISNCVAYFGLQYNVVNLAGSVFLNFFILSIVEIPGNTIFWITMEKLGRRWTTTIGCFGIALSCLLPLTGHTYAYTASSVIGKLIASGVIMVIDQQGCELFPTSARSIGMGTGKTFASAALLVVPYFVYLSIYSDIIPYAFIGSLSTIAAVLSTFLPETLNENLPQTFLDADNFGKDHKYFSLHRKEKPNLESTIFSEQAQDKGVNNSLLENINKI